MIFWTMEWLLMCWESLRTFHCSFWINSQTLVHGFRLFSSSKFSRSRKHRFSIQLSYQNEMSLPSPTLHTIPCCISSLHFIILLQTLESLYMNLLQKKSWFYMYLVCIIRTHILSLLVMIFQANLHWNVVLTTIVLRRPFPPLSLAYIFHSTQQGAILYPCCSSSRKILDSAYQFVSLSYYAVGYIA